MKHIILSIYIVLLALGNADGQITPPIPEFVEAKPLWYHALKNEGFTNRDTLNDIDCYESVSPFYFFRYDESAFYFITSTWSGDFIDGYFLYKVDRQSGQLLWRDQLNSINSTVGKYTAVDMRFLDDGNIEVIGNRQFEPSHFNDYPLAFRRIYSPDGEILSTTMDSTNIANIYKFGNGIGKYLPKKDNSGYRIIVPQTYRTSEDSFNYRIIHHEISHDLKSVTLRMDSLYFQQTYPANAFSFKLRSFFVLNDSVAFAEVQHQSADQALYPDKMYYWFVDISDPYNLKTIKQLDVSDKAYYSPFTTKRRTIVSEKDIFYIDGWYDWQTSRNRVLVYRTDLEGNEKFYSNNIQVGDHVYKELYVMASTDSSIWLICRNTMSPRTGFDFVRVDQDGSTTYLGSITTIGPEGSGLKYLRDAHNVHTVLDDGTLIFAVPYSYPHENPEENENSVFYYMAFRASDLGIDTPVANKTPTINQLKLSIHPNPSASTITIGGIPLAGYYTATIVDQLGRQVSSFPHFAAGDPLDVNPLPSGVYYVKIIGEEGKRYYEPIRLVKQ